MDGILVLDTKNCLQYQRSPATLLPARAELFWVLLIGKQSNTLRISAAL
jgi:hypothetical protein